MSRIFISYRREDTEHPASRLADDLRRHFGEGRVFHDIGDIDPGADFVEVLKVALDTSAAVLVVIGRNWLTIADRKGRRRLDNPEDWVRIEVAESLKRSGVRVFPVLVDDADMPDSEDLPECLRPLTCRNAFPMTVRHWANDVAKLVASLRKVPGLAGGDEPEAPRPSVGSPPAVERPKARPSSSFALLPSVKERLAVERQAAGPATPKSAEPPGAAKPPPVVHAPGTIFRDGDGCPEMVVIPAGEFMMGSPEGEEGRSNDEGPRHKVTIARPFAAGRYPVTFDEWDAFLAAGGTKHKPDDRGWGRGRQPVVNVSWEDAQAYVKWLAKLTGQPYRLLSEAEWEYAARAGSSTRYPWGDDPGSNRANFRDSGSQWSGEESSPVGSFESNAFGLHDMIGNVWEWTQDCWNDSYKGAPAGASLETRASFWVSESPGRFSSCILASLPLESEFR